MFPLFTFLLLPSTLVINNHGSHEKVANKKLKEKSMATTDELLVALMMVSQKVVFPAKAGIQSAHDVLKKLDSCLRRNDGKIDI